MTVVTSAGKLSYNVSYPNQSGKHNSTLPFYRRLCQTLHNSELM